MRKGFWRIAAAFCLALAAASIADMASPSTAVASEVQSGNVYVYSNQHSLFENGSVAVGQRLSGSLDFWLQGNVPWEQLGSAAQDKKNYKVTVSDDDRDNISLSYSDSGQWSYVLNPKTVGDGKLRITVTFNYGDYSTEGYLEISLAEKLNPVTAVKYISGSNETSSSSAAIYYTDNCSVCGKAHCGDASGYILFAFERPSEEPTVFDIDSTRNDWSGSKFITSVSLNGAVSYDKDGYQKKAPIRIAPCGKDGNEVEVRLNYFQGDLQTKKLCDASWHKQNPAYVEENLSGTMAVGSHAWVGAADLISIQLNPVGQACRESYSSREFKYTIKDGDGVISIDEYGIVWAKKVGVATIVATDPFGQEHTGTIRVVALPAEKPSIKFLESKEITLSTDYNPSYEGSRVLDCARRDYHGTVMSADAINFLKDYPHLDYYCFKSSDEIVARVTQDALDQASAGYVVSAVGRGTATVDVYLGDPDNGGLLCDTLVVHVVGSGEEPSKTTVSIADGYATSMDKGATQQLKAKVSPDDKAGRVVWSSSNESVLTVDANGLVAAVGDGTASITATVDGVSATTDAITVTTPVVRVSSVSLSASNLKLAVDGEPSTLTATVEPDNATNKNVSWSSSDPEVATVADGVVTPVKAGAATITVTTEDGEYSATCKVTVIQPATGITLDKQKVTLVGAATEQLKATVVPAEADQTVVWKSSNDSVATVDQTGKVTSVSKGAATITASTEDGTYSQDCAVTVSNPATSLTVDQSSLNLAKGEEGTVKASLAGALAGEVDETKLALDDTGASKAFKVVDNGDGSYTVTALKTGSGSFVITAGSLSQTVSVSVTNPAQKVELNKTNLSFTVGDASAKLSATVTPADADDTTVSWTSSDSSIATVKDGVVTPLKAGTVTITATCGDKTATCAVTVAARTIAGVAGSDGTDVSVSAENNAAAGIAQNNSISLVVEEPTNLTDAANATISGLEQGATKVAEKLDIKLLKNGEVIEDFDGMSFIVRVKMTAAMKALTNLKVLYVAEDGSTQAMDTWTEGDYLCFRTSHFSTYVVTGEEANGEPVQPTQPVTPSQPSQQTTTKVTKKSTKTTKGALANTGDQAPAVAFIMAVAGASLIAFALMRKRLER